MNLGCGRISYSVTFYLRLSDTLPVNYLKDKAPEL